MKLTVDFERGDHGEAVELVNHLLENLGQDLEKTELIPSEDQVFRVSLDNKVVFDSEKQSFQKDRIKEDIRELIREEVSDS